MLCSPTAQHPLSADRAPGRCGRVHDRAQGPGPSGAPGVHRGRRRALPDRLQQNASGKAHIWPWPTPKASAARAAASWKRPSGKRPKPTCSVSRPCCAAALAELMKAGSTPWSRPVYEPESGLLRVHARDEASSWISSTRAPVAHALTHTTPPSMATTRASPGHHRRDPQE
jgi:hypothetical protein